LSRVIGHYKKYLNFRLAYKKQKIMFEPKYKISETILKYLTEISESRAIILNSPLIPKWDLKLRREAILNSTHASTSIEGNSLSFDEVSDLMIGRDITAIKKDKQEVLNYFEALEYLDKLKEKELTNADILKLHKIITKDTLEYPEDEGKYRYGNKYVIVGNKHTGEITFKPPPTKEVPALMNNLIKWLNQDHKNINPVIQAGVIHYEFVRIHPFIDGNGRTSRALATLILIRRGFDTKRFFALDDFYNSNRPRYYKILKKIDPETLDLTEWLDYFCEGVAVSIKAVKDKIMLLTGGKSGKGKQLVIDDRQIKIVEYIKKQGKTTNKEIQDLLNTSNKTAYNLLINLLDAGVIKKVGQGRATIYVLE